jgi:hypothetical protein
MAVNVVSNRNATSWGTGTGGRRRSSRSACSVSLHGHCHCCGKLSLRIGSLLLLLVSKLLEKFNFHSCFLNGTGLAATLRIPHVYP